MTEVKAIVFQGRKTAEKALDGIADEGAYRWLDDVGVVSRGKHGMVRVHSTWAQDDSGVSGGIGWGALTGGLIGALMGPQGAVAGALGAGALAGGSLGGLMGLTVNAAVEDPRLDDLGSRLKNDTSALILVADTPAAGEFVSAFGGLEGELVETNLNEHDVKALREALKADRKR